MHLDPFLRGENKIKSGVRVKREADVHARGCYTLTWSESNRQIGQEPHKERSDGRDGSRGSDEIASDIVFASVVYGFDGADGVVGGWRTDAGSSSVR